MKKKLLVPAFAITALMLLFFISCRHEPIISCADINFKITVTKTDALLNKLNGSITVTATGGDGFKYSIDGMHYQDSGYFSGLEPLKTYTAYGRNSMGCIDSLQVTIGSYNPCDGVVINLSVTKKDASQNKSDGSITATATGATGLTYSLNAGAFQTSGTFANLAAGNYTVAAKSADGCMKTTQVAIGAVNPCAGITVVVTTAKVLPKTGQSNGSITATATGGTGFTYSLNNGAFQTGNKFSNLAAGNYTVTAKNSNGCTGLISVPLDAVNPCAGVTIIVTTAQVNPNTGQSNGSITATATGGTGFTYSLNNSAFQTSNVFSNLATGNYTITAKNSNGCTGIATAVLGAVNPCAGVAVAVATTQINPATGQSNGSITATATGGSGFTYSINNGTFQSGGTFSNLAGGTYTITAKNSNGCIGAKQVTLTAVNPCAGVTVTVTATQTNPATGQSNGSINATATGGTGFTYSLNNGTFQSSGIFSNLAVGNYTITAKNSNGCIGAKQVTLTAVNLCNSVTITITPTVTNTTPCASPTNNGSIAVAASGSTGFTYNNNGGAYQSSNTFSALNAGTYLIGVKDVNGCTNTQSVNIGVAARGSLFAQMRSLITTRCSNGSGCHINGGSSAGYNFDSDCSIISKWSQINGACITGTLANMPINPQVPLTAAEKKVITDWINAGHGYKN
jgi:inosine/xanthosine triphosphate pyrophosphatase family protein